MGIQFLRPRVPGRIEFSARLLLNFSSGYSKNRVGFLQIVSAYWHALRSALAGNANAGAEGLSAEDVQEQFLRLPFSTYSSLNVDAENDRAQALPFRSARREREEGTLAWWCRRE